MKRCPNNHDNPDNAKFCRICGYNFDNSFCSQLKNYWNTFVSFATRMFNMMINEGKARLASIGNSSVFTPDMFPNINLSPCSVAKVDFQCKKGVFLMVVLVVIFGTLTSFEYELVHSWIFLIGHLAFLIMYISEFFGFCSLFSSLCFFHS